MLVDTIFDRVFYATQVEKHSELKASLALALKNESQDAERVKQISIAHFNQYGKAKGLSFSPYFDITYYAKNNDLDPKISVEHYLAKGADEGLNFSPYFDVSFYVKIIKKILNLDIVPKRVFEHFIQEGEKAGLTPSPLFDVAFYSAQNGIAPQHALRHFILVGIEQGLNPSTIFDVKYYANQYKLDYQNTITHFLTKGIVKHFNPSLFFDLGYYIEENFTETPKPNALEALAHYVLEGKALNLSPSPYFDSEYYQEMLILQERALLEHQNPFDHFITLGESEGLSPLPFFDKAYYLGQLPEKDKKSILQGKISAIRHFLTDGALKTYNPSPLVDLDYYCLSWEARTKEKIDRKIALYHFLSKGTQQDVSASPVFDPAFYRRQRIQDTERTIADQLETLQTTAMRLYVMSCLKLGEHVSGYGISPSVYMDIPYYSANTGVHPKNAVLHFLLEGIKQGINPSQYFDLDYYAMIAGVTRAEALGDFLTKGLKKGLNPSLFFDIAFYTKQLQVLDKATFDRIQSGEVSAVEDFTQRVVDETHAFVSPSPYFNVSYYRSQLSAEDNTLIHDDKDAYNHFLQEGFTNGINSFPLLDLDFYALTVNVPKQQALKDFLLNGAKKNTNPSLFFDTEYYKKQLPQDSLQKINRGEITPVYHYLTEGKAAGYNPSPLIDLAYAKNNVHDIDSAIQEKQFLSHEQTYLFSPFLDVQYYSECAGVAPKYAAKHYLLEGRKQGLSPCLLFDVPYYSKTASVKTEDAFADFLCRGEKLGFNPSPFFDVLFFKEQANKQLSEQPEEYNALVSSPLRWYLLNHQRFEISPSSFFDIQFYLKQVSDSSVNASNALFHFLNEGEAKGYNPSPYFDVAFYLSQLTDGERASIDSGEISPIRHYLLFGLPKGISPTPYFDVKYYAAIASTVTGVNVPISQAINHYFLYGRELGISPSPLFDLEYYSHEVNKKGLSLNGHDPFHHYITEGINHDPVLTPSPYIDIDYYAKEAKVSPQEAVRHFIITGESLGLSPTPFFDVEYYVKAAKLKTKKGAFADFLSRGEALNISPSPFFDVSFYRSKLSQDVVDIIKKNKQSLLHYFIENGDAQGISPSPYFDVTDVRRAQILKALRNFIVTGEEKGENPSVFFETKFYSEKASIPYKNALRHYVLEGYKIYSPSPFFNLEFYRKHLQKIYDKSFEDKPLLHHFLVHNESKNVSPSPVFEPDFFLKQLPEEVQRAIQAENLSAIRYMLINNDNEYCPHLFFDPIYYKMQLSGDALKEFEEEKLAIRHYLLKGDAEKYNPSPFFDRAFYLQQVTDLKGHTALEYYILHGRNHNPFPFFDEAYYNEQLKLKGEELPKGMTLLDHFITIGAKKEYDPSPFFETSFYKNQLASLGINLSENETFIEHFLRIGELAGYQPSPYFDAKFYGTPEILSDAQSKNISLVRHYLLYGENKNLSPCLFFEPEFFENHLEPEVLGRLRTQKKSSFRYFLTEKQSHNASPSPFFDSEFYQAKTVTSLDSDQNVSVLYLFHDFLVNGEKQNISCSPYFEPDFYLNQWHAKLGAAVKSISAIRDFIEKNNPELSPLPFFDRNFYLNQMKESEKTKDNSGAHLLRHYCLKGAMQGYQFTPFFDFDFYLTQLSADIVLTSYQAAFRHFLMIGQWQGMDFHPAFENEYYQGQVNFPEEIKQQIEAGTTTPIRAFLMDEKNTINLSPTPFFDANFYIAELHYFEPNNKSVNNIFEAYRHFLVTGLSKGRAPVPFLDLTYYAEILEKKGEITSKTDYLSALRKFRLVGENRGDSTSDLFDSDYYIEQLSDVEQNSIRAKETSPLRQYLETEPKERKIPTPFFVESYYLSQLALAQLSRGDFTAIQYYFLSESTLKINNTASEISPSPYFNAAYYHQQIIDLNLLDELSEFSSLVKHFFRKGQKQGLNPSAFFDVRYYSLIAGVPRSNAIQDYLIRGLQLSLSPSPFPITIDTTDNGLIQQITDWQKNVRNNMPFILDWLLIEKVSLTFATDVLPFISDLAVSFSDGNSVQSFYQIYPEYVERYRSYKRLSVIQEQIQRGTSIISITGADCLKSPLDSAIATVFERLNGMDAFFDAKIDSASSIVSMSKNSFLTHPLFNSLSQDQKQQLPQIYILAESIVANVSLNYINAYQSTSPYVKGRLFASNTVNADYSTLFGSLDYYKTDANVSIYSPAAYFFDLMRITHDNLVSDEGGMKDLMRRRPDLYEIPLDAKHTFDTVVYLQIVNYVLSRHCINSLSDSTWQSSRSYEQNVDTAEQTSFTALMQVLDDPYNPPSVLPLEASRVYLKHLDTSLFEFYSVMHMPNDLRNQLDDYDTSLAYLDISMVEIRWINNILSSNTNDLDLIGKLIVQNDELMSEVIDEGRTFTCKAKDFFALTQSSKEKIATIIPYKEKVYSKNRGFYEAFYINAGDEFAPMTMTVNYDYKLEIIHDVTLMRLKKLALAQFFAKKLDYSLEDVQLLMNFLKMSISDKTTHAEDITSDIKTLALLKWIAKKANLTIPMLLKSFFPISQYDYQQLFYQSSQTKSDFEHYTVQYDFSSREIVDALNKLLSASQLADQSIDSALTLEQLVCIQDFATALQLKTFADLGALINVALIKKINTNGAMMNWCSRVIAIANLCGVTLMDLLNLYQLLVGNEVSNYPTILEGLHAFIMGANNSEYTILNNIALLYEKSVFFKENNLQVDKIHQLIYPTNTPSTVSKKKEDYNTLSTECKKLLDSYLHQPSVKQTEIHLSNIDAQICQQLATHYTVDFNIIIEIMAAIVPENASKNVITAFLYDNTELADIGCDLSKQTSDVALVDKVQLNASLMLTIQSIFALVQFLNLSSSTQKTKFSDVAVLVSLLKCNGEFKVSLDIIETMFQLKALQKTFKDNTNQFLTYYSEPLPETFLSYTKWNERTYHRLSNILAFNKYTFLETDDEYPDLKLMIQQVSWLNSVYALLNKTANNVELFNFVHRSKNDYYQILTDSPQFEKYYTEYALLRTLFAQIIQNKTSDGKSVLYELSRKIEVRKRDVLVLHLLKVLNDNSKQSPSLGDVSESVSEETASLSDGVIALVNQTKVMDVAGSSQTQIFGGNAPIMKYSKASDLSAYILLDVETDGVLDTSLVSQGISSLQLYLQRCRLGVESARLNIPEKWWTWLENYRLWEANRKTLIDTENYIEPDLRTQQSEEYKTFTQTLSKSNWDDNGINDAFREYFHQAARLSNMVYVDACQSKRITQGDGGITKTQYTVYLFARTNTLPNEYYYRTVDFELQIDGSLNEQQMDWGYWNKISANMNTQLISPVYAYNRLFIFWVETKTKQYQSDHVQPGKNTTSLGSEPLKTELDYKILYTYQNANGTWEHPQTIVDKQKQNPAGFLSTNNLPVGYIDNYYASFIVDPKKTPPATLNLRLNKVVVDFQSKEEEMQQLYVLMLPLLNDANQIIKNIQNKSSFGPLFYRTSYKISWGRTRHHDHNLAAFRVIDVTTLSQTNNVLINDAHIKQSFNLIGEHLRQMLSLIHQCMVNMGNEKSNTSAHIRQLRDFRQDYVATFVQYVDNNIIANLNALLQKITQIQALYNEYLQSQDQIEIQYPSNDLSLSAITQIRPVKFHLDESLTIATSDHPTIVLKDSYNHLCLSEYQAGSGNTSVSSQNPPFLSITPGIIGLTQIDKYTDLIEVKGAVPEFSLKILGKNKGGYLIFSHGTGPLHYLSLSAFQAMNTFNQSLFVGNSRNLDNLYPKIQSDLDEDFKATYGPIIVAGKPQTIYRPQQSRPREIDFNGGFGPYYWETFFFIPFYVANQLNVNQNFSKARDWYHYIFYPYRSQKTGKSQAIFQFPPFQNLDPSLDLMTYQKILEVSDNYAFDPHAIAKLRPLAYMKAVVMRYIRNLIDWGDNLFQQNTRETINLATNLYMMANDLLGDKPEGLGYIKSPSQIVTLGDYYTNEDNPDNEIPAAFNRDTLEIFKFLENTIALTSALVSLNDAHFNYLNPYFSIPENEEFIAYWDRVSDRLFKIRCSLNMEGIKQSLALFSPEIDMHQLIRAAATGGLEGLLENASAVPIYRFSVQIEYAKSFISQVTQLGNTLLSILERSDSESLTLLFNNHQASLLDLMTITKQNQVDLANYDIEQTEKSKESIENRVKYYKDLIQHGLLKEESDANSLKLTARGLNGAAGAISTLCSLAYTIPQTRAGFVAVGPEGTVEYGGLQVGHIFEAAATGLRTAAEITSGAADDLLTKANYARREQEWKQQLQQAQDELAMHEQQITMANLRLAIAKNDFAAHQLSISHQHEINKFYQEKFTNKDLYQWMISQLMSIHKQIYDMAFSVAQSTEKAYKYELNSDQSTCFSPGAYDCSRKGLLAGESLTLQLTRLEKAFLDKNKRCFEITKVISLKKLAQERELAGDNSIIAQFKAEGTVDFSLSDEDFDQDFVRQGNRRIKSLSVSVPALTGPFQSTNLVLTQHQTEYVGVPSQIIISTGVHDTGVFGDGGGRYLPFEGTSVNSSWTLALGNLDGTITEAQKNAIKSVSDVVITLQYTAEPSIKKSSDKLPLENSVQEATPSLLNSSDMTFTGTYQQRSTLAASTLKERRPPSYLMAPHSVLFGKSSLTASSAALAANNTSNRKDGGSTLPNQYQF